MGGVRSKRHVQQWRIVATFQLDGHEMLHMGPKDGGKTHGGTGVLLFPKHLEMLVSGTEVRSV